MRDEMKCGTVRKWS